MGSGKDKKYGALPDVMGKWYRCFRQEGFPPGAWVELVMGREDSEEF